MQVHPELAEAALLARDPRFDGQFVAAVRSTKIYCRPSCPARTPLRRNVLLCATTAAAQLAGYRACRRCLPDQAPAPPSSRFASDAARAAMALIDDGVVDREGVPGLARRLGCSERHVDRLLVTELGAPPLALARARRARVAQALLLHTDLRAADVAVAAGFASVRQFNDTVRHVFAAPPTELRARRPSRHGGSGALHLRLPVRAPFDGEALLAFFAARAIPGVERVDAERYTRTLRLPAGRGVVALTMPLGAREAERAFVEVDLWLEHLADLAPALARARRIVDADADPIAIATLLGEDPALARAVARAPGLRIPGSADGPETLLRALFGQQVSVAAARTRLAALADRCGEALGDVLVERPWSVSSLGVSMDDRDGVIEGARPRLTRPWAARTAAAQDIGVDGALTRLFPTPEAIARLRLDALGGPRARASAIRAAATALAEGSLVLDAGRRTDELTRELVARSGIGPWTAGYVALRTLGEPDVLLSTDLALLAGAARLGLPSTPRALVAHAERWRPFRSYAGMLLWAASSPSPRGPTRASTRASTPTHGRARPSR